MVSSMIRDILIRSLLTLLRGTRLSSSMMRGQVKQIICHLRPLALLDRASD
jgi:hypothetical protein